MTLDDARIIIEAAPKTHLGEAARMVLAEPARDEMLVELGYVEHMSGVIEGLRAALDEERSSHLIATTESRSQQELAQQSAAAKGRAEVLLAAQVVERDRLAMELAKARVPSPELERLRGLEAFVLTLLGPTPNPRAARARERLLQSLRPWLPPGL